MRTSRCGYRSGGADAALRSRVKRPGAPPAVSSAFCEPTRRGRISAACGERIYRASAVIVDKTTRGYAIERSWIHTGYFSEASVGACQSAGIEPIALGREAHHPSLAERFAAAPPAPENPTPLEAMAHRLQTLQGKALYALRKHTPEPVFGIIKSVLGFRQFLLRGPEGAHGEWKLVTMAWNLKRMFALGFAA
jgi:hypothetical protein